MRMSWDRVSQWEIEERRGGVLLTLRGGGAITPLVVPGWTLDDLEAVMRDDGRPRLPAGPDDAGADAGSRARRREPAAVRTSSRPTDGAAGAEALRRTAPAIRPWQAGLVEGRRDRRAARPAGRPP